MSINIIKIQLIILIDIAFFGKVCYNAYTSITGRNMRMNIIIVGCGKVGNKLAQMLSDEREHNITVIDIRGNVVNDIVNQYDAMGVVGKCNDVEVLYEAGISEADLLIAVTGSDELNLMTCLLAKKTGGCQTIARVRAPEYSKTAHIFKEDLGLAMIINPEQTAAKEMAKVLRFPTAMQIDTFAKGKVEILKFKIPEGCVLDNLKLCDLIPTVGCDILVCGVEREEKAFIPRGDFVLKSGDKISIVASLKNVSDFFKRIKIKTNSVKDTMIVGGGPTAIYLADILMQAGIDVKIIEQNEQRCELLSEKLPKAVIINGDGTDTRLLLEEGIEYAESFVALTNIDEENILLSLFAKCNTKGKVITKINKITYGDVIASLNLDTIVYPKDLTAEYIIRFVRAKKNSIGSNIETMHLILDNKAEALEFSIKEGSPVSNIPIEKLKIRDNTLIACITRGGKVSTPRGRDIIQVGDTVIVVTTHHGFKSINDILE